VKFRALPFFNPFMNESPKIDNELIELQQHYVRSLPEKFIAIQALWKKLLSEKRQADDVIGLYTLLHNLRGSGAIFGFDCISDEARPLERMAAALKESGNLPSHADRERFEDLLQKLKCAVSESTRTSHSETYTVNVDRYGAAAELVLIVDDDNDLRQWILEFLRKSYRTAEASDGEAGLIKTAELFPDLIISDVVMPKMDGYRLCHAIKSDPRLSKIPVILLTAESSEEQKVAGLEYGADDYVTKPFSMKELLARVKNLVKLKQTQSQMIHSAKMAALGQLVAGAAHELNNPLSVVIGNLGLLETYFRTLEGLLKPSSNDPSSRLHGDIHGVMESCRQGTQRIKTIVAALMTFSQLDRPDRTQIDIRDSIENTLTLFLSQYKSKIKVETHYGPLQRITCMVSQMNQVLMNLLINAAQAIEERNESEGRASGHIWIRAEMEDEGSLAESRVIRVSIKDDGHGIPNEIRDQIFNPFFTTRPIGKAPGLGLAISHNIVANHNGKLYFNSEVGQGTEFIIELPVQ